MKYRVYFYFDAQYQGYVAEALDLPGCASQGKTMEEAKRKIRDASAGYLEFEDEKSAEDRSYRLPEETFIGEVAVG